MWNGASMKVLILGGDGYLGWPTAMYLSKRGHSVLIVDNMAKRRWEAEVNATPLFPVPTIQDRTRLWHEKTGKEITFKYCDISTDYRLLNDIVSTYLPDAEPLDVYIQRKPDRSTIYLSVTIPITLSSDVESLTSAVLTSTREWCMELIRTKHGLTVGLELPFTMTRFSELSLIASLHKQQLESLLLYTDQELKQEGS